jgi:hypothetical protein
MWCVCPRRGGRKVSLQICVGVCEVRDECEEFKEARPDDVEKARAMLNKLPAPLADADDIIGEIGVDSTVEIVDDEEKKEEGEASFLLGRALSIKSEIEGKFWEMGAILNEIFRNQYYVDYGYHDWKEFCSDMLDMRWRTATYLRDIYVKFTSLGIKAEDCIGAGWGKLKEVLPIVTKDNVKYWLGEAKKKKVSVAVLNARVRHSLGKITKEEVEKLHRQLIFRLYDAQLQNVKRALELARRMTGSDSRAYQLEMICAEFRVTYEVTDESHPKSSLAIDLLGRIENLLGVMFKGEIMDAGTGEVIREVK